MKLPSLEEDKILFYDIECYTYDSFVVFKDIEGTTVAIFKNDFSGLWELIKDKTLIGFNNYFYDDKMITMMLRNPKQEALKRLNDDIISGKRTTIKVDSKLTSLDVFQQISVSKPSLKKIEGNMGKMILESSIPFDVDHKLTDEEYREALDYCSYDVDMVIEIFKMRKHSYFDPKMALVNRMGNTSAYKWNTTTLSANMLTDKKTTQWSSIRVPEDMMEIVPPDVKDLWLQINEISGKPKKKSLTVKEFENDIQFGFGGLHSTNSKSKIYRDVILTDVGSLYPSIINNLNVLGESTELYDSIRKERLEVKRKGEDKVLSDALKLILNSVYGLLKNQYSILYNPRASATVCIYGQIILYELAKRLSSIGNIIQCNTDGVMFQTDSPDHTRICEEWEKEFEFTLDNEYYDLLIQRDVNNYIAVEKGTGNIKVKGGDVGRYHNDKPFDNNSTRIVDIAIVDYLVYGKDILETIVENLDKPKLFQYILKAGGTFDGTFEVQTCPDGDYLEIQEHNKVNRVFATKKEGILLTKRKTKEGQYHYSRFPDTPDKMYLWNDDCCKLKDFRSIIDINWYYQLIKNKLKRWE